MAHHKVHISLGKVVKGSSFGEDTSDHLMCDLAGAFLVGALGIAEEDAGAKLAGGHVALNGEWIGKLAAPVSQDDREERLKHFSAQDRIEGIENLRDRSGGVVIPQEGEHELTIGEEDRKENLPAFATLYRIHLNNGSVRIGAHVFEVIRGSPRRFSPNGTACPHEQSSSFCVHGNEPCGADPSYPRREDLPQRNCRSSSRPA